MEIYYMDKDIVVCEKPYGISSQVSERENMISMLMAELDTEIYPIHRLDLTTTGLIVYALNKKSAASLSDSVAKGLLHKEYYAVVHGKLPTQGELNDLLLHDKLKNKSFVVNGERKGVKRALLRYRTEVISDYDGKPLSLVRIELLTGRTHQIRVQMANIGSPLYGDGKYGAKDNDRMMLHSAYLSFPHPITKKNMEFTSLPEGKIWSFFLDSLRIKE